MRCMFLIIRCRSFNDTRSQAVARIADRTASQQTLVIIAIVLIGLAYYECISLIYTVSPKKHVTTFSTITLTTGVRLQ